MIKRTPFLKHAVASVLAVTLLSFTASAQTDRLDELFQQLAEAEAPVAQRVEAEIWIEWSRSGSASVDLLLERGRKAMEDDDIKAAIEHLTAVVDHAPDFAEGYNARATAYFRAGLYGPSIDDIGRAVSLNPRHFGALSGLAIILEELGYEDRALEVLREVEAIYPAREGLADQMQRLEELTGGSAL